jgi:hypothetical protein
MHSATEPLLDGKQLWRNSLSNFFEAALVFVLSYAGLGKLTYNFPNLALAGEIDSIVLNPFNIGFGIGLLETLAAFAIVAQIAVRTLTRILLGFFATTAIYGASRLLGGSHECHCFGAAALPRIVSIGLSMFCIVGLVFNLRQYFATNSRDIGALPAIVGLGFCLASVVYHASAETKLRPIFRADCISSVPNTNEIALDFFDGTAASFPVEISNYSTSHSIQIIGIENELHLFCYCRSLPLMLAPGEVVVVNVHLAAPRMEDSYRQEFVKTSEQSRSRSPFYARRSDKFSFICANSAEPCGAFVMDMVPSELSRACYERLRREMSSD